MSLVVIVGTFYTEYEMDSDGEPDVLSYDTEDVILGAFEEKVAVKRAKQYWNESRVIDPNSEAWEGPEDCPCEGIRLYSVPSGKAGCKAGKLVGEINLSTGRFNKAKRAA